MFLGEHRHTLDAKGRISLPAKFRNALTGPLVVMKGFEGCLYVIPTSDWEGSMGRVLGSNDFDPRVREVRRVLMSGSTQVELDSAGRVSIPLALRQHADLDKEVAVIGNGERIELWDAKTWEQYSSEASKSIEESAASLAAEGLL